MEGVGPGWIPHGMTSWRTTKESYYTHTNQAWSSKSWFHHEPKEVGRVYRCFVCCEILEHDAPSLPVGFIWLVMFITLRLRQVSRIPSRDCVTRLCKDLTQFIVNNWSLPRGSVFEIKLKCSLNKYTKLFLVVISLKTVSKNCWIKASTWFIAGQMSFPVSLSID